MKNNINFDFLSVNFIFKINWISNPSKPGVFDFFVTIARSVAFAWIVFFIVYSVKYKNSGAREFDGAELTAFVFVYAFFEEQSRWIFSSMADSTRRACLLFFFLIVATETSSFWILSPGENFFEYMKVRTGSVIVHGVNAWICYASTTGNVARKILLFSCAVIFHCFMNVYGNRVLAESLLGG